MRRVVCRALSGATRVVPIFVAMICWSAPASAANLFANVNAAGTLISGGGVAGVAKVGPGQYEVTFTSDVSACAYLATTANAYSQALQVFTAGGHFGLNGVYVETKNQGGGLTDGPFHLVVVCGGTTKMKHAVVGYAGELVRGTPGVTLAVLGPGRYAVTFLEAVSTCAYLATVADPGSALVYSPSGVYTGSGANSRTVYIETKNPGGGLQSGVPFHLGVICSGAPKTFIAVVRDTGLAQRGSPLTSTFRSTTGHYAMVTPAVVNPGCATVATRGSVDRAVPYTPATVEIIPGPAPNAIGIQMRALLYFGGAFTSQAFHAATVCP
jgi:hypothetical protein